MPVTQLGLGRGGVRGCSFQRLLSWWGWVLPIVKNREHLRLYQMESCTSLSGDTKLFMEQSQSFHGDGNSLPLLWLPCPAASIPRLTEYFGNVSATCCCDRSWPQWTLEMTNDIFISKGRGTEQAGIV